MPSAFYDPQKKTYELNIDEIDEIQIQNIADIKDYSLKSTPDGKLHEIKFHGGGYLKAIFDKEGKLVAFESNKTNGTLQNDKQFIIRGLPPE